MSKNVHIAALIMAKNESKRIQVTLNSLKSVNSIVFYDTGSADNTIDIVTKFCSENKIELRLKKGKFIDFATSRNVLLDYADSFTDIDYYLLMDVNDELRSENLREFCINDIENTCTGYLVCQEWWSGNYSKYFNIRLIKARKGWKYHGKIHEWLKNETYKNDKEAYESKDIPLKINSDIITLYQDRTQDDDKTGKRFSRDKFLLLKEHEENPKNERTVFYLAQTLSCLNEYEDSLKYYIMRSEMDGFWEEKYHSLFMAGELSQRLNKPWETSLLYFMKSLEICQRVEPALKIAEYYQHIKNWVLSYTFIDLACKLPYPDNCMLFVDKLAYDYKRWHLLGIIGWYAGFTKEGKAGCLKAIESGNGTQIDLNNLKHYK